MARGQVRADENSKNLRTCKPKRLVIWLSLSSEASRAVRGFFVSTNMIRCYFFVRSVSRGKGFMAMANMILRYFAMRSFSYSSFFSPKAFVARRT